MSATFESRSQDLLALSSRANSEVEACLRRHIKEMILQEIQRGGSDLAEGQIRLSRDLANVVSKLAPKNKYAQTLPRITSSFIERRKTGLYQHFLRVEGKIDGMKGTELFRLFRTLAAKHPVWEVLDSLDEISS